MPPINASLKNLRQEVNVSKHVPITHFNSPTILETQQGAVFSVIRFSGVPFETEKNETLNGFSRTWHRALTALDPCFAIIGTLHRRKVPCALQGEFSNAFAQAIDSAYQTQFEQLPLYVNDLYVAVILKGDRTRRVGWLTDLFQTIRRRYVTESRCLRREYTVTRLNQTVFQLMTSLAEFEPHLVGSEDEALGYSELLAYVSLFVNGGEALQLKNNPCCPPIEKTLDRARQATSLYPHGHVAQYLTAKRLFFGDYIQFQGALEKEGRFAAMVTIKRYGMESASMMLDPLLHLNSEFIATQSFMIAAKPQADQAMKRQSNKMQNAEDPAMSQIEALDTARDLLASDQIMMGYHHNTVMLLSDSLEELEQQVAHTIACYMNAGIVAVRETIGQESAFWSQIPTNANYIARASLISSKNFVDFFPLHNYRTGFYAGNHLGCAMTLVETPSRTPLWLNLHVRGPKDNPSPGHTTLIGGNGSGKTVMMCFFDAQLNRYGGCSYFFDRDRGAEIYLRASGADYKVLSPNHKQAGYFNPLSLPDSPTNRKFCKELLVQLVRQEGESAVDERVVEQLSQCVDYAYDKLAKPYRTLTHATKLLPVNFARWIALKRWLKTEDQQTEGEYAYLFDNEVDALTLQTKMGFDMTHFLDNEPPEVLAAVLSYLFYRIEMTLKSGGPLVSIFLDEAWQYLENEYWQAKLKKWLPTLRKYNCHLIFATQSPQSVISSPLSHFILDNCATHIYFANPQAKPADYIDGFNLTGSEFYCIKENEPQSRLFLYKQGHQSALGRLNLTGLGEQLKILSGTQASVALLTQIRAAVGEDPSVWLPLFLARSRLT